MPALQPLAASHTWHPSTLRSDGRTTFSNGPRRLPALPTLPQNIRPPPIRRMPAEVLEEIFKIFSMDRECKDIVDNRSGPILLTHVCKEWRRVAIGAAFLWSHFRVELPGSSRNWDRYLSALSTWVQRSGRYLLTTGCCVKKWDQEQSFMLSDALAMLCRLCYRWEVFEFEAPSESLPLLCDNVPFLSSSPHKFDFRIQVSDHASAPSAMEGVHLPFLWLSRVRDLSIVTLCSFTLPTNAPWRYLDTLRIETRDGAELFPSVEAFVHIMSQCYRLTSCSLTLSATEVWNLREETLLYTIRDLSGSIELPSLEYLDISVPLFPLTGIAMFELFTTPALERLTMHGPVVTTWDVGRRLVQRSECKINDIYLDNLCAPVAEVGLLLHELAPTLKRLEVRIPEDGPQWSDFETILDTMTVKPDKITLCPLLDSICFSLEKQLMLSIPVLTFLASRTYLRRRTARTDVAGLSSAMLQVIGSDQDLKLVERMMDHEKSLIEGKKGKCEVNLRKF